MSTTSKILFPYDFTEYAADSFEIVAEMARIYNASVVLYNVFEPQGFFGGPKFEEYAAKAEEEMESMIKRFNDLGIPTAKLIGKGKPYRAIVNEAKNMDAELIIMGTSGASGLRELFLGSNAATVVRSATVPVITVEQRKPDYKLKKLLIPVDIEFGIREMRKYADEHFELMQPEIKVISVMYENDEKKAAELQDYLDKQEKALKARGFENVSTEIVHGDIVSETIVRYAEDNNFDLVAMETHGRKGIGQFFIGNITEEVVNHCKVPVMTIRPSRHEHHEFYHAYNAPF